MAENMINIDGKEYDPNALSENARAQILNLRVADQEIARLQAQLALAQTARATYSNVLKAELNKVVD